MRVVYSARYRIDIGPHVFPTDKYQRIHARLLERGVIQPSDVVEPEPASWDELALVHSAEYLEKMREGTLSLGEAFAFMSALYFRGKLAYAKAFGCSPEDGFVSP